MSPRPKLPESTDTVVIGGGIMGTATAYFLANESDRNVLLVERDNIAAGSTGDSSAIIRYNYGTHDTYSKMTWWSQDMFSDFEAETGQEIAYVECPRVRFAREGTEQGAFIEAGYEVLQSLGIPVERLEGDLAAQFPMFEGVGTFDFAIEEPAAAYSDAVDVTNGFARGAEAAGATIVTGVEVEHVDTQDGSVVGVETAAGRVACDEVVVAAGPWTPEFADDIGVNVPMMPTREEVFLLDPPESYAEEHLDDMPMMRFHNGQWYIRPDFNGGVLIATHPFADEPADPDTYDDTPDQETALAVYALLEENVPGLLDADIKGQYCGLYSTTPDHDFVIDQAGPEGCYFAAGFSGHGFKVAPAVGKIMRDLVVDGETDLVDISIFSLDRFERETEGHGQPVEPL